jgi:carbonic anhydrase
MIHIVFASSGPRARAVVCGVALCMGVAHAADAPVPHHWSYSGENGPEHWGAEDPSFATCSIGKHQSPINIEKAVVKDLPELKFDYKETPLKVTDTGHSFQVNAASGTGSITVGEDRYDFLQVHFHEPSEESVQGEHYSMVAHIVHKNAKGELAVVAVLIRKGKANEFLKSIFDNFPAKGSAETDVAGKTVNVGNLLPQHHGYYTFDGSLTTPPCSENVRWLVLKTPVEASEAQLKQFQARYSHNNRPTQPLNGRVIEETRAD